MSDYYWPKKAPTDLHISYIDQVRYSIHPTKHGYFEVKQTNMIDGVTEHRVNLPTFYKKSFAALLWRLYLAIRLHKEFHKRRAKKFKDFRPRLLRHMVHLDNIVEAMIRPALDVPLDAIADWRNPNFDEYLVTEFLIGRHDPTAVYEFRNKCETNLERIPLIILGR